MTKPFARLAAAGLLLAPASAWAHPGHPDTGGLAAGLAHPLTGLDHFAAMLLLGVWAALLAPRSSRVLALPGVFLGAMLAGFASSGLIGATFAAPLITASLVALGLAAALPFHARMPFAMIAAGVFGFAHGLAHGTEMPSGASAAFFALGFAISTAALHGAGLWLARIVPAPVIRVLGGAGVGLGLLLASAG